MKTDWVTKVIKIGNSYGVILPVHYLRLLKLDKPHQFVKIGLNNRTGSITIAKTKKPKA